MKAQNSRFDQRVRSGAGGLVRRVLLVLATAFVLLIAVGVASWSLLLRSVPPSKPRLSWKMERGALEHGSRSRTFLYYVPTRLGRSPSLVIVFHSSMSNGSQARRAFGYEFDRLADEHGFIVVYPDGVEQHWNDCRKKAPYAARRLGIDDVGFTRALVAHFRATTNIDRVFATGWSNGGQMAIRLALEAPDLVDAVAPVIASLPTEANMDCRISGVPVSILFMNGTADPMNPYEGGDVELYGVWGNRGAVRSSIDSAAWFARLAGYAGRPERATLPDRDPEDGSSVERVSWTDSKRKSVVLYSVRGGGHTIPHPTARAPRLLGRTNADIRAAEEIWSFFRGEQTREEGK